MNQILANAQQLVELTIEHADLRVQFLKAKRDLELLELKLTPEKWTGANETERKLSKDRFFASVARWVKANKKVFDLQGQITKQEAQIEALKIEQDAFRWLIRDEANVILGGVSVFDVAMEKALDEVIDEPQLPPPPEAAEKEEG